MTDRSQDTSDFVNPIGGDTLASSNGKASTAMLADLNDTVEGIRTATIGLVNPQAFTTLASTILANCDALTADGPNNGTWVGTGVTPLLYPARSQGTGAVGTASLSGGSALKNGRRLFVNLAAPVSLANRQFVAVDVQLYDDLSSFPFVAVKIGSGTGLTGTTSQTLCTTLSVGVLTTVLVPVGALGSVRSIGLSMDGSPGGSGNTVGALVDNIRLSANTALDKARALRSTVVIPADFTDDPAQVVAPPDLTVTNVDLRPDSSYISGWEGIRRFEDYGADDTGVEDSAPMLQQALNDLQPGESLRFPYRKKFRILNTVQILGLDGNTIDFNHSAIICDYNTKMFYLEGNSNLTVLNSHNVGENNQYEALGYPPAPTPTLVTTAGSVNAGVHRYAVAYELTNGDLVGLTSGLSRLSPAATVTTDGTHGQVDVSAPVGPTGTVVARRLYRQKANDGVGATYYLQQRLANNTSTSFVRDNTADSALVTAAVYGAGVPGGIISSPQGVALRGQNAEGTPTSGNGSLNLTSQGDAFIHGAGWGHKFRDADGKIPYEVLLWDTAHTPNDCVIQYVNGEKGPIAPTATLQSQGTIPPNTTLFYWIVGVDVNGLWTGWGLPAKVVTPNDGLYRKVQLVMSPVNWGDESWAGTIDQWIIYRQVNPANPYAYPTTNALDTIWADGDTGTYIDNQPTTDYTQTHTLGTFKLADAGAGNIEAGTYTYVVTTVDAATGREHTWNQLELVRSTLGATITNSQLTFTFPSSNAASAFPTGAFSVRIEDEIITCTSRSGATATVAPTGRGAFATAAVAHSSGAAIRLYDGKNQLDISISDMRQVLVTLPGTGDATVAARKVYRSTRDITGAGQHDARTVRLVATIANNTSATYTDTTSSVNLGAVRAPTTTAPGGEPAVPGWQQTVIPALTSTPTVYQLSEVATPIMTYSTLGFRVRKSTTAVNTISIGGWASHNEVDVGVAHGYDIGHENKNLLFDGGSSDGRSGDHFAIIGNSVRGITVRNMELVGAGRQGSSLSGGHDVMFDNVVFIYSRRSLFDNEPGSALNTATKLWFRDCTFINPGFAAITLHRSDYTIIERCRGIRPWNATTLEGVSGGGRFLQIRNSDFRGYPVQVNGGQVVIHDLATDFLVVEGTDGRSFDGGTQYLYDMSMKKEQGGSITNVRTPRAPQITLPNCFVSNIAVMNFGDDTTAVEEPAITIYDTGASRVGKGITAGPLWFPNGQDMYGEPTLNSAGISSTSVHPNNFKGTVAVPTGSPSLTVAFPTKSSYVASVRWPLTGTNRTPVTRTGGTLIPGTTYYYRLGGRSRSGGPAGAEAVQSVLITGTNNAVNLRLTGYYTGIAGMTVWRGTTSGVYTARYDVVATDTFYNWGDANGTHTFADYGSTFYFDGGGNTWDGQDIPLGFDETYPLIPHATETGPPATDNFTITNETGYEVDADYSVFVTTSWHTTTTITKTRAGFTVSFGVPVPTGTTGTLEWMLVR